MAAAAATATTPARPAGLGRRKRQNSDPACLPALKDLDTELRELPGRYSPENMGCIYVVYPVS